jgi:hypothetical protein
VNGLNDALKLNKHTVAGPPEQVSTKCEDLRLNSLGSQPA